MNFIGWFFVWYFIGIVANFIGRFIEIYFDENSEESVNVITIKDLIFFASSSSLGPVIFIICLFYSYQTIIKNFGDKEIFRIRK